MSDTPAENPELALVSQFDQPTLIGMRLTLKRRLSPELSCFSHPTVIEEYTRMLEAVDAELEVRARRRQAEFSQLVARATLLLLCIVSLFGMGGCVSTPDSNGPMHFATAEARNRQLGLTALMAVDTAQTVTIGRSSECLYEANPVAAAVFGSATPSPQRVLITNTLYIASHWLLASYLDRRAERPIDLTISATEDMARRSRWRFMRGLYQGLTLIGHGAAGLNNQVKGIRPFSSYECGGGQ